MASCVTQIPASGVKYFSPTTENAQLLVLKSCLKRSTLSDSTVSLEQSIFNDQLSYSLMLLLLWSNSELQQGILSASEIPENSGEAFQNYESEKLKKKKSEKWKC